MKRHTAEVRKVVRQHRGAPQTALITVLNPKIRGWAQYYRTCVAKQTFSKLDRLMYDKLAQWASWRHPCKRRAWRYRRYWRRRRTRDEFSDGKHVLNHYADMPIVRHVKVKGNKL